jgi:hypothetical protein
MESLVLLSATFAQSIAENLELLAGIVGSLTLLSVFIKKNNLQKLFSTSGNNEFGVFKSKQKGKKKLRLFKSFRRFKFLFKKPKIFLGQPHWANLVSIISGGLSIILLFLIPLVGLLFGIGGIVFGIVGLKEEGKVLGIIGIVLGSLTILITLILILFIASFLAAIL